MTDEVDINMPLLVTVQLRLNTTISVICNIGFRPKWESVIRQSLVSLTLKDRKNGMYHIILYVYNKLNDVTTMLSTWFAYLKFSTRNLLLWNR